MGFRFRYWWYTYKNDVRRTGKMIVFFAVGSFITTLLSYNSFPPHFFLIAFISIFLFELVFFYGVFLTIKKIIDSQWNYKYYKILNEKGYCKESLDCLQQKYIQDKPVHESYYIDLAEHYRRFGDYDSAIKVLNSIHVPESNAYLRTVYIFVLIKTAVNNNDTALADNTWKNSQNFINYVISEKKFGAYSNLLYVSMIYADCIAGRYERAFQTCDRILGSKQLKKFKEHTEKFLVIKIYLLKKLGRESEMNTAITEFNNYDTKKWKPLFDATRTDIRNNVEKAIRGEMPV